MKTYTYTFSSPQVCSISLLQSATSHPQPATSHPQLATSHPPRLHLILYGDLAVSTNWPGRGRSRTSWEPNTAFAGEKSLSSRKAAGMPSITHTANVAFLRIEYMVLAKYQHMSILEFILIIKQHILILCKKSNTCYQVGFCTRFISTRAICLP
jgi:hypothetical protein